MTKDIKNSEEVDSSRHVYSSRSVDSSSDVDSSRYVDSSSSVDSSSKIKMCENVLCCYDVKLKEFNFCNKQLTEARYKEVKKIWNDVFTEKFKITKWVKEEDMTDEEKKANTDFCVNKGYLKLIEWEEAWQERWANAKGKEKLLELPEFDPEVFKSITGIDIEKEEDEVEVVCEGKKARISRKSAEALNLI